MKLVFGIPGADGGIAHRDVQQREQPGVLFQRVAPSIGDNLRNTVPMAWRRLGAGTVGPE